jgi:hypothetical protein
MRKYGLDAAALVRAVEQLTGDSFGLGDQDFLSVSASAAPKNAKAEDL